MIRLRGFLSVVSSALPGARQCSYAHSPDFKGRLIPLGRNSVYCRKHIVGPAEPVAEPADLDGCAGANTRVSAACPLAFDELLEGSVISRLCDLLGLLRVHDRIIDDCGQGRPESALGHLMSCFLTAHFCGLVSLGRREQAFLLISNVPAPHRHLASVRGSFEPRGKSLHILAVLQGQG